MGFLEFPSKDFPLYACKDNPIGLNGNLKRWEQYICLSTIDAETAMFISKTTS